MIRDWRIPVGSRNGAFRADAEQEDRLHTDEPRVDGFAASEECRSSRVGLSPSSKSHRSEKMSIASLQAIRRQESSFQEGRAESERSKGSTEASQ